MLSRETGLVQYPRRISIYTILETPVGGTYMKQEVNGPVLRRALFSLLSEGRFFRWSYDVRIQDVRRRGVCRCPFVRATRLPRSLIFGLRTIKNVAHAPIRDSLKGGP